MYAGFNLHGLDDNFISSYKGAGEATFNIQKSQIQKELNRFILDDGSLDGSALQDDWFPSVNADIFLSHSHGDQKLTMAFAAMLKDKFGLTSFIDSCVWGYADELLKKIDDIYCRNETNDMYDYNQRNFSTSHVHMMLSSALRKMMDKTECIIFINTPNSITTRDAVEEKMKSPWIYDEIVTSQVLRKKKPVRSEVIQESRNFEKSQKRLNIVYKAELDHLTPLTTEDITSWESQCYEDTILCSISNRPKQHALDSLYRNKGLLEY